MTDFNSTLLACEPFVRYAAYTLWRVSENPAGPTHKPVKVPVHYDGITRHSLGRPARGNRPAIAPNPAPPLTAAQAVEWLTYHRSTGTGHDRPGEIGYLGAGFRPQDTGLVCIDLDDCVVDGVPNASAQALIARFPGALVELSVSGRGLHIWVTVTGEGPGRRPKQVTALGEIEVYGAGQFIAFGRVLHGDASTDHTLAVHALIAEFWPDTVAAKDAGTDWSDVDADERARVLAELRSALPFCDQSGYHEWTARGLALATLGDDDGLPLWHELSALHPDYDEDAAEAKWFQLTPTRTGYQAIFSHAEGRGWTNPRKRQPLPTDASNVFAAALPSPLPAGAVLEPPPSRQVAPMTGLSFMAAAEGAIKATVASVESGLLAPEAGVKIAYDIFKDRISISVQGAPWRQLKDTDYGRLRAAFERQGFKAVPAEAMQTAVAMVAEQNQFDSLIDWASALVWDKTPRIARLLPDYYGAEDTPYSQAVGEYAFTALAGRALEPGVQADMAIIMVGLQGGGKTSALNVLAPEPEAFGEVDLGKDEDVIARKLRGKCLIELAEMRGFKGRDAEANKAWVSRRKEEWTPKYKEFTTTYWRRCLIVGTANDDEQLDDPTGARRFLPIHVGRVDRAKLAADRDQLWAEGVHRFREGGVAYQMAEELAKQEHHKFEVVDELQALVENYLASPPTPVPGQPPVTTPRGANPVRGVDILMGCYGMPAGHVKKADQMALAKIMKRLGYRRANVWSNEIKGQVKMWVRGGA